MADSEGRRLLRRDNVLPWLNLLLSCGQMVAGRSIICMRRPNAWLPPYILVDPNRIAYRDSLSNDQNSALLFVDGDWDLQCAPLTETEKVEPRYRLPFELNVEQRQIHETSEYRLHVERLTSGRVSRKLRSLPDVKAYMQSAAVLDQTILKHGYRSQAELGLGRFGPEVEVTVGRDGQLMKRNNGGNHRFAMARFHGIARIPVTVTAIHTHNLRTMAVERGVAGWLALRDFVLMLERAYQ
jgi:hypothetical protein